MLFETGAFHHVPTLIGANRDEGWGNFINRSFPSGVTLSQYEAWVAEFGAYAPEILELILRPIFLQPQRPWRVYWVTGNLSQKHAGLRA